MICDLAIIGAGPAGAQAAFTAAALGLKTVLVEQAFSGGACLNSGCIPTKFLLGGSAAVPLFAAQKKTGVLSGEISVNLSGLQDRKERYIKGLRSALEKRLTEAGVLYMRGRAAFTGAHGLELVLSQGGTEQVEFKKCVIATGSVPAFFPGLKPDGAHVISSSGLLNLRETPASLIIIGGGVIGLELGEFFARLGSRITVIEAMERIALSEDAELGVALHRQLTREGWDIKTGCKVQSTRSLEDGALVTLADNGEELRASKVMLAMGRAPARDMGWDKAGIKTTQRGWIITGPYLEAASDIYAVGDINGRVLLAHAAEHQGEYAARRAAGLEEAPYDDAAMPACVYGHYEIMHVGPRQEELLRIGEAEGQQMEFSRVQMAANPIAQGSGFSQGMIKIGWLGGRVHSVAAWGHGAAHLLSLATVMVKQRWSAPEIIFAHPTLDEALKNALTAERLRV